MAKKRKSRIGSIAKGGKFVTPVGGNLGQYMKFGDYSEAGGDSKGIYGGIAYGQGYKAFQYGNKLYKKLSVGGPDIEITV